MDPITLIAIVVCAILLGWLVTHVGMVEPGRTILIAVLVIALLYVVFRLARLV